MEQTNIENQIKSKMNLRSIQPIEKSWERLDAMLSIAEPIKSISTKEKTNRKWGWIYIAASFLGIILVGTSYFYQTSNTIDLENNKTVQKSNSKNLPQNSILNISEKDIGFDDKTKETIAGQENNSSATTTSLKTYCNVCPNEKKAIKKETQESEKMNFEEPSKPIAVETRKPSISQNQIESQEVLVSTQSTTNSSKNDRKTSIQIDPKSLLLEVEVEINQTFRETTLEKISRNLKTIKTAVTNINN